MSEKSCPISYSNLLNKMGLLGQVTVHIYNVLNKILSVPKFTAKLYCICLSIPQIYTILYADAIQIRGKFWQTQYFIILIM